VTERELQREKPSPACLSHWQVSQWVLGILESAERDPLEQHLQSCEHCTALIAEEKRLTNAARFEPVPQHLKTADDLKVAQAQAPKTRHFWQPLSLTGFAAAAAALLWFALPDKGRAPDTNSYTPQTRIKGRVSWEASLIRGQSTVMDHAKLSALGAFENGDVLKLYVHGAVGSWVRVEGWQDQTWQEYFVGLAPEGGELPIALELDQQGETKLRLSHCPKAPADITAAGKTPCTQEVIDLSK